MTSSAVLWQAHQQAMACTPVPRPPSMHQWISAAQISLWGAWLSLDYTRGLGERLTQDIGGISTGSAGRAHGLNRIWTSVHRIDR